MKLEELHISDIAGFLKYEDDEINDIKTELDMAFRAAIQYVQNQTGVPIERLQGYEDITYAVAVLVQDMMDNRRMYVDSQNVNKVVESIIYQYSENLL